MKQHFGKKLRDLRKKKGFKTQKALADAIGADRTRVSRWESGENSPDPVYKDALIRELGVTMEFFDTIEIIPAIESTKDEVLEKLEAKIDAIGAKIQAPAADPKDLEDAAKWREFEAKYLPLGQDLIEKLMTIDLKDKIFLWDHFGLPEHPNILAAKRKIRVEAHKQESQPAPHKQAVDYPHRKK